MPDEILVKELVPCIQSPMMKQTKEDYRETVNVDQAHPNVMQQARQLSRIRQLTNNVREIKLGFENEITALGTSGKLDQMQNQDVTDKEKYMNYFH